MRLLKLGIYHDTYLRDFYSARTGLSAETYAVQHRALIDDCYGSSDFWTSGLNKLGYETADTIANTKDLQRAWAHENNFRFDEKNWMFEIASQQINVFRPDILLIADYSTFTADFLKSVRRECPFIRLILGWCGAPYRDLSVFREWDVALSCIPELVQEFRLKGLESHHVDHAFAPRILQRIDTSSPPDVDFGFIGSVLRQNKFHIERERLLLDLIDDTDLEVWSDLKPTPGRPTFKANFFRRLRGTHKSDVRADPRILQRSHPAVFGLEMFQKLRNMRVCFNNHIDISPISASNMRLFETTGVGTCLLTDDKKNLHQLFEPGKEVVTYASARECVEKVRYLLENEDQRRAIAEAGQRRTLREHTFDKRASRIDEIIRQAMAERSQSSI